MKILTFYIDNVNGKTKHVNVNVKIIEHAKNIIVGILAYFKIIADT